MKKNNKYRTIVFGGNNPIFIPGHTDEKLYDEMYVNNNLDSLDREKQIRLHNLWKTNALGLDVDFLKNLAD